MISESPDAPIRPTQLFRIPNYRYLWLGQIVSDFGDSLVQLAMLLLINHLTGSVTALATLSMIMAVPRLVFGLLSGVYVDRFNRRHIMLASDLSRALLVLAFILVDSPSRVWILYLIGFLQGSVMTFFTPARSALMPNLVPARALLPANSIAQTTQVIFALLGNTVAGLIIGFSGSYWPVFALASLTYFLSFASVFQIRHVPAAPLTPHSPITLRYVLIQLQAGLKVTFSNPILAGSIVALSVTMLGIGAVNVLMVPLVVNVLKVPETWFGLVGAGETVGTVLSGAVLAWLAARFRPQNLVVVGLLGAGLFLALVSTAQHVGLVVLFLFLTGLCIPPISASVQTILQTEVPDDLRGRTSAANNTLTTTAMLLSMAAAGVLADAIGVRLVFVIGGGLVILAGVMAFFIYHKGSNPV